MWISLDCSVVFKIRATITSYWNMSCIFRSPKVFPKNRSLDFSFEFIQLILKTALHLSLWVTMQSVHGFYGFGCLGVLWFLKTALLKCGRTWPNKPRYSSVAEQTALIKRSRTNRATQVWPNKPRYSSVAEQTALLKSGQIMLLPHSVPFN